MKVFYLSLFLLGLALSSVAQSPSLEVFYGANFSYSTDTRFGTRDAATYGVVYHFPLNELVRYNAELSHRIRGAQRYNLRKNLRFVMHRSVFEIKYPFFPRNRTFLLLGAGAYVGFKYEQNSRVRQFGVWSTTDLDESYKTVDTGLAVNYGFGVILIEWLHLHFRGNVDLGVLDLYKPSTVATPYKVRDFGIMLGAEVLF